MSAEDWRDLIGNLGFPIAVTAYVLVRMERALKELASVIAKLCDKLDK